MEPKPHAAWYAMLSPREQATIDHARVYARDHAHAGVPGHSAHLLIAKLADLLDTATVTIESGGRDVTAAISPAKTINDAMSAIEDIAELVGWPCFDSNQSDDNFSMQFKCGGL